MIGSALYLLILAPLGILVARLLPAGRGRNWAIAALSALSPANLRRPLPDIETSGGGVVDLTPRSSS